MPRSLDPNKQYEVDGKPMVNGYLWYGVANQDPKTNPIIIYSDEELTVPIDNPQRTDDQGRSFFPVFMAENEYSFLVEDSEGNQIDSPNELEPLNVPGLISANIDMNGFKHINVGDATENNEYSTLGQSNKMYPKVVYTNGSSTPDAISVDLDLQPDALEDKQQIIVGLLHGANTVTNPTFKFGSEPVSGTYRDNDTNLEIGDTGGLNYFCHFVYNQVVGKWNLNNPRVSRAVAENVVNATALAPNSVALVNMQGNSVDSAQLIVNSVGQSEIAPNAVHRSEISTSFDIDTLNVISNTAPQETVDRVNLAGGGYSFFPETSVTVNSGNSGAAWFGGAAATSTSDGLTQNVSLIAGQAATGGGNTPRNFDGDVTNEYVDNSPPYNLGHGDMPMIAYLRINKQGIVTGTAFRETPPWVYNGPTNVDPDRLKRIVSPDGLRVLGVSKYKMVPIENLTPPWEGGDFEKWANPEMIEVEITQKMKNADMHLHPHPFLDVGVDERVVMIDPCSSIIDNLHTLHKRKENVGRLYFKTGFIEITDEIKGFNAPKGVAVVGARWKNKRG